VSSIPESDFFKYLFFSFDNFCHIEFVEQIQLFNEIELINHKEQNLGSIKTKTSAQ